MVEAVPDGGGGTGEETGSRGSQGSTSATPTPIPTLDPLREENGLFLDKGHMLSPIAMVDLVNDNLAEINKRLAGSDSDAIRGLMSPFMIYSGIFGDVAIESAWSAFHLAWVRETSVTSSAIAELRKLLPDAAEKYGEADHDGGRVVGGVDVGRPDSGVFPSYQPPITTASKPDLPNSSDFGVAEPHGNTQGP
ncbi:hypothetical protein AB4305_30610 [Nocardia sp. 2YAB30]|uniref:hypothetical protein n=1 Tax=Nocardia sp. 2YAB30 TaxID=3233022 RepID=UPI003F9B8A10